MKIRTYKELSKLSTFEDRFKYLKLDGSVGKETFGFNRYINQTLYKSHRWNRIRSEIIMRDCGCDLGIAGYEIYDKIIVHHMNPITIDDIYNESELVFSPEFLICTTHDTHNAIHYGSNAVLNRCIIERRRNDTCPWKS